MTPFFALALLLWPPRPAAAAPLFVSNQSAAVAVGQQSLSANGINGSAGVAASGLSSPNGVWSDGNLLIVADAANNRVLIYNSVPIANGIQADVVVGQPDTTSSSPNQGGARGANTLFSPTGVFFDGANLYVVDQGNNRVLIFNALPAANNTSADVVVGQPDMASGGAATTAAALSHPSAVYSDGTALYVADQNNHRVLIYNPIPTANGAGASVVAGQAGMNSGSANQGVRVASNTLNSPAGVFVDSTSSRMLIADQGNNRVLIYNSIPTVNNSSASVVVGQVFMTSAAVNQGGAVSAWTLNQPAGVASDGTRLYVADQNNSRILIYSPIPVVNNSSASVVAGQVNMTSNLANRGRSSPAANTLARPFGIISNGAALYAADMINNRILVYNAIPTGNGASADVAVGQSDMVTGTANQAASTPGGNTSYRPAGAFFDRTRLYVADKFNNRVLIYNAVPLANNASADVVVGQANMASGGSNQGASVSSNTLSFPNDVYYDGAKLYVADQSNQRVLIYNGIPAANNAQASVVVGQADMVHNFVNQGTAVSSKTLSFPAGVFSDGTRLFVSDRSNNRVLIYNPIPAANNPLASVVLGQVSMSTNAANQGSSVSGARTLNSPAGIFSDGTKLFIADQNNNRVLIFNSIPAANDSPADVVVGQPDMVHNFANQGGGPRSNTLNHPTVVSSDGTSLYIVDQGNNRVLVYKTVPTSSNAPADFVLGQSSFNTASVNLGGLVADNTLSAPAGVVADSTTGRLFVTDFNNNRTLIYLPAVQGSIDANGGTVTLNAPIEPVSAQVQIPPGALGQAVRVTVEALSGFPSAPSSAGVAKASGVGMQILLDQPIQPVGNVTISLSYKPSDIAGLDKSRLILARYDPGQGVWVPLPSVSDAANGRVVAQSNHFSMFQIMQVDASANTISSVRAFPNPFMPSQGHTTMTFAQTLPGARVRIYNALGVLIKDLSADSTGIAHWDGTNQSGAAVASGVYFAFVQGSGQNRTLEVAVQR